MVLARSKAYPVSSHPHGSLPTHRFVCVGASNLFLCFPDLLDQILLHLDVCPLSVLVACGPGRAFGAKAGMLGARFAPISHCGVLEALETDGSGEGWETWALITDIGNDVLYGIPVDLLHEWLEQFTDSLRSKGARVGITALATDRLMAISERRYQLVLRAMCPRHRLGYTEARSALADFGRVIDLLGDKAGVKILPVQSHWYGFDGIHLRQGCWKEAAATWLNGLLGDRLATGFAESAALDQSARRTLRLIGLKQMAGHSNARTVRLCGPKEVEIRFFLKSASSPQNAGAEEPALSHRSLRSSRVSDGFLPKGNRTWLTSWNRSAGPAPC